MNIDFESLSKQILVNRESDLTVKDLHDIMTMKNRSKRLNRWLERKFYLPDN